MSRKQGRPHKRSPWTNRLYELMADGPVRWETLVEEGAKLVPRERALAQRKQSYEHVRKHRGPNRLGEGNRSAWGRKIVALLTENPMPYDDLLLEVSRVVPPGRALRERETERGRKFKGEEPIFERRVTTESAVSIGQRAIARDSLVAMAEHGTIEVYEEDGVKMARLGEREINPELRTAIPEDVQAVMGAREVTRKTILASIRRGKMKDFKENGVRYVETVSDDA